MWNVVQVPSELFWQTKFFSQELECCVSQLWRRSIFKFCVYKLAETVTLLKFNWEFVIIGRGCLVFRGECCVLKPCKHYFPLISKSLVLIRHPGLRADSQWIIILKTVELVTLSLSQFYAQRNWLLTHALHIFTTTTTTTTNFVENWINI